MSDQQPQADAYTEEEKKLIAKYGKLPSKPAAKLGGRGGGKVRSHASTMLYSCF